jgi:hypothetical protein
MRYLVGFGLALALVAFPQNTSAQAGEEGTTSEPNLDEPVSSPPPGTEVPDIDTLSQRAIEHYEIRYEIQSEELEDAGEKMELRVKRAKIGYGVSAGVLGVGVLTMLVAGVVGLATWEPLSGPPTSGGRYTTNDRALIAGAVLASSGLVGMITAGGIWGHRKRKLPSKQELRRLERRRSEQRRPDDEPPAPTEPSRLRGPSYRPH